MKNATRLGLEALVLVATFAAGSLIGFAASAHKGENVSEFHMTQAAGFAALEMERLAGKAYLDGYEDALEGREPLTVAPVADREALLEAFEIIRQNGYETLLTDG
jgi:hypothetical protein